MWGVSWWGGGRGGGGGGMDASTMGWVGHSVARTFGFEEMQLSLQDVVFMPLKKCRVFAWVGPCGKGFL